MLKSVKVSVVTTVRDKPQFEKSAACVVNQKGITFEYIVVDYGSTDLRVKGILKKLLPGNDSLVSVRYIRVDSPVFNRGIANNVGFQYCSGDYVLTFDCDLLIKNGYIGNLYDIASDTKKCLWCVGIEEESGKVRNWCGSGIMFVSLDVLFEIKGYDESFDGYGEEDIDFRHRIIRAGYSITKVGKPGWVHMTHSNAERSQAQYCARIHKGRNRNRDRREINDAARLIVANSNGWGKACGLKVTYKELK